MKLALVVVLFGAVCCAQDYQTAKLTDVRSSNTGAGSARAQFSYCLAVDVAGQTYLSFYEGRWRHSYEPTDLAVGDDVKVRLRGRDLFIKRPDGKELKTHITRRERNTNDQPHATCALAVSTR